jgi:hypothetical protein
MVLLNSRRIPRVRRYSGVYPGESRAFAYGTVTLYGSPFQCDSASADFCDSRRSAHGPDVDPTTPHGQRMRPSTRVRFRLFPFRSPLLRESRLLSFPGGTEMFQFSPLALPRLWIQRGVDAHDGVWVAPFGNPRIKGCLHLPEAYRSLPRPSSPAGAKASTVRL